MSYKAGSAFITVAPSFDNFQKDIEAEIKRIGPQSIDITADTTKAKAEIDKLRNKTVRVKVDVDTTKAATDLDRVGRDRKPKINPYVDAIVAESAMVKVVRERIAKIIASVNATIAENTLVKVTRDRIAKIGASVESAVAENTLLRVARDRIATIKTKVDGDTVASAKLDYVARTRTAKVKVDVDKGGLSGFLGKTQSSLNPLSQASIGGMFTQGGMIQAGLAASPVLGPAALGGGLALGAGIVGSAGLVGVAAAMVGSITKIIGAQKDLKTATQQQQAASVSLAAAQNGVISAQESLANSVYNVGVAERNVTQAQIAATMAQTQLNDAREAAQRQLEGLTDDLKGAALAESGAKLAVEQAIINLQKVERDPRATRMDVLMAEQALGEARLQSDEASRSRKYAIEDAKKLRSEGVKGNEAVVSARTNLSRAQQGVADAQHNVAIANQQVADSPRALAQSTPQDALAQPARATATTALGKAQDTLKPKAVQDFTAALQNLKDTFATFLTKTNTNVLGAAAAALGVMADILHGFGPATSRAAGALLTLITQLGHFVKFHPLMQRFFLVMENFGPIFIKAFGNVTMSLIRTFLRLFLDFAPLMEDMAGGMVHMFRSFERWTWGLRGTDMLKDFIKFIKDNGPVVLAMLGGLATIGFKLIQALAPVAAQLLKAFLPVIQWLAKQDPDVLLAIAAGIAALIDPYLGLGLALAAAYGFAKKIYDSNPKFKRWVDGVGDDISGFASDVKDGFDGISSSADDNSKATYHAWHSTGMKLANDDGIDMFGTHTQGTFEDTSQSADDNSKKTTSRWTSTFTDLGKVGQSIKKLFGSLVAAWQALLKRLHQLWDVFGGTILDIVAKWIDDVLQIFQHFFDVLGDEFQLMADLLSGNWSALWGDLKQIGKDGIKLVWSVIQLGLDNMLAPLKLALTALSAIWGLFWDNLGIKAAGAINWVINNVLNKLIDAMNWLKDHTIGDAIADIPHVPTVAGAASSQSAPTPIGHHMGGFAAAEGGVLPGYTPGRDVHVFHSATGGTLALSGGESIMVPQWTKAMGGARAVKEMNARAKQYAGGGIYSPMSSYVLEGNGLHDADTGYPALDLGTPIGTPVHAVAPGRVMVSKDLVGYEPRIAHQNGYYSYGRYIQVAHEGGFQTLSAHLAARLAQVGQQVAGGQLLGFSGLTGHTYGPHLHFGAKGASPYDFIHASTDYPGGLGAVGPNVLAKLAGAAGGLLSNINPLHYLENKLSGLWDGAGAWSKSPFGSIVKAIPLWMLKKIVPHLFSGLLGKAGQAAGAVLGHATGPVNGAQGAQAYAQSQLSSFGWGQDQFVPLVSLWNKESGWAWNAANPAGGNPATSAYGIPQSLPGSKMAAAGSDWVTNPVTQIMWGLRYIKEAYGSPSSAFAKWMSRADPSGKGGWYDGGGIASGRGFFGKNTIRPERILSPQQTQSFDRLVSVLDRGTGSGKVSMVITNWKDGSGYMSAAADFIRSPRTGRSRPHSPRWDRNDRLLDRRARHLRAGVRAIPCPQRVELPPGRARHRLRLRVAPDDGPAALNTVLTAKLRLATAGAWGASPVTVVVTPISAAWSNSEATWANQPTVAGTPVTLTKVSNIDGDIWEFDVSAQITAAGLAGRQLRVPGRGHQRRAGRPVLQLALAGLPADDGRRLPGGRVQADEPRSGRWPDRRHPEAVPDLAGHLGRIRAGTGDPEPARRLPPTCPSCSTRAG